MSLNEGAFESTKKEFNIEPLSSKVDFPWLELVEQQPSSYIHQGEVLEEPNVVSQVEIKRHDVHDLWEMDQFEQPQSDQILSNCSGNIVANISKIETNPSQLKKKSTIISSNFPKRVTMTKGPTKDVTQYLAIQGRPKRIKQKEVMKLLVGSPSMQGWR